MSIAIMTQVWNIDLPASQKIVLLALADCANDEGLAWPGMASLSRKCSKSERTIQTMMGELEAAGHITRQQVPGKGCRYIVHPGKTVQPMQGYMPPESHYIYRIDDADSGEFYIGARTCVGPVEDDDYMGSGNWTKAARLAGRGLRKTIIQVLESRTALAEAEVRHVEPVFGKLGCMNAKLPTPGTLTPTGFRGSPASSAPRNSRTPQISPSPPQNLHPNHQRTIKNRQSNRTRSLNRKGFQNRSGWIF